MSRAAFVFGFGCLALVLCSSSARAQTTLFHENFEAGTAQWSTSAQWHLADEASVCGTLATPFPTSVKAMRFGNTSGSSCSFGWMTGDLTLLTPISIPAGADFVRLRYFTFEETECVDLTGWIGNCGWDHRTVSVSTNGGVDWIDVQIGAEEGVWHERAVDLDAYAGQDILVRFRFEPIDGLWNNYLGWLIDEVRVEYGVPTPIGYCTAKVSSMNCTPTLLYSGTLTLSGADDFYVGAAQILNQRPAKLIWSRTAGSTPFHGGTLCIQPPAARTSISNATGSPLPAWDCTGQYWYHFSHAYLASKAVVAGETLHIQFSGRDPLFTPPNNHSLSAALAVMVLP